MKTITKLINKFKKKQNIKNWNRKPGNEKNMIFSFSSFNL